MIRSGMSWLQSDYCSEGGGGEETQKEFSGSCPSSLRDKKSGLSPKAVGRSMPGAMKASGGSYSRSFPPAFVTSQEHLDQVDLPGVDPGTVCMTRMVPIPDLGLLLSCSGSAAGWSVHDAGFVDPLVWFSRAALLFYNFHITCCLIKLEDARGRLYTKCLLCGCQPYLQDFLFHT